MQSNFPLSAALVSLTTSMTLDLDPGNCDLDLAADLDLDGNSGCLDDCKWWLELVAVAVVTKIKL